MYRGKSEQKIKLVLIDKYKLFREGIGQVLKNNLVIDLVAEGETKEDAVQLAKKHLPHVILIDIKVIAPDSLKTVKDVIKHVPQTKVIVLSEQDDDNYMIEALKMGATGYVIKEMNPDTFISAIKAVGSGRYWYDPYVTHYLISDYYHLIQESFGKHDQEQGTPMRPVDIFTPREFEVLQLLAKGYSNKVIGEKLNITNYTVSSHVRNILKKSKVNDRTHAVVKAIENGWVTIQRK